MNMKNENEKIYQLISLYQIYVMYRSTPNSSKKLSLTIDAVKVLRFL